MSGSAIARLKPIGCAWLVAIALLFTGFAQAQDDPPSEEAPAEEGAEGAEVPASAIYLPIKPPFVVNYGGAGRLKYIKTELSVRLLDTTAANAVRHHLPYVRNNLVLLFSSQTDETMSSQEGREALRIACLKEIREIIKREEGDEVAAGVIDVFFNSFIVQR